jgi:serine protease DegQ
LNIKERVISALIVGAILATAMPQLATASLPLAVDGQVLPSLAPMIERVQASLVRISVKAPLQARRDPSNDPFFRRFFDQRRQSNSRPREMFATGVVVDSEQGLI